MAEGSIAALETVAKYETDPISSNSDGGKKIRHVRVGHSANKKAKILTNLLLVFPAMEHQVINIRSTTNMTTMRRQKSNQNFFEKL